MPPKLFHLMIISKMNSHMDPKIGITFIYIFNILNFESIKEK